MTTLHAFNIPEDDTLLPSWLEQQIASPHLGELVAELEVLQEVERAIPGKDSADATRLGQPTTLDSFLGNRLPQVCQRGLAAVPPIVLRRLFRRPDLLIELQNQLLTAQSAYWDQKLAESDDLSESVGAGWTRLTLELGEISPPGPTERPASSRPVKSGGRPIRWYFAGLATAAAIAVAAFVARDQFHGPQQVAQQPGPQGAQPRGEQVVVQPPTAPTGWGWSKPNAFPNDVTRKQYLAVLADEAEQWRNKRPDTREALAQRINEFRQGCSRLILADHKPLPPPDDKWLVEKCRQWAGKLDANLAALEAGQDVLAVRGEVDQLVDKLAKTLRDRAAQPA
jgi:hypothetical protein